MSVTAPASSANPVANLLEDGKVSGQQLFVIVLCVLFNMVDGFDITAMAIVATSVGADLDLAPDRIGLIFSAALAGMMAGAMGLAALADVVGRRKMIIASLALIGASISLTANAQSLGEFVALRFVSGLGGGALLALQATMAAEYSPEKWRSLAVTIVTMGYPAGAMMTSVVGDIVMPDYGWRGMFWFGGAVTLLMAAVALVFLPESLKFLFERRPQNTLERINVILPRLQKKPLDELPAVDDTDRPKSNVIQNMLKLLAKEYRAKTLILWLTFFMCFSALYFLMSWIPPLMERSGFSAEDGRRAFFLFNLSAIFGVLVLGTAATRWKLSNLVAGYLLLSAVSMVWFAVSPSNLNLLLTITFLLGFLQQGGFMGLYAVAAKSYPTEIRGTGIGWCIGLGRSGAVAGPAIAGYLITAGFDMSALYFVFAVPMAIGGLLAWRTQVR